MGTEFDLEQGARESAQGCGGALIVGIPVASVLAYVYNTPFREFVLMVALMLGIYGVGVMMFGWKKTRD